MHSAKWVGCTHEVGGLSRRGVSLARTTTGAATLLTALLLAGCGAGDDVGAKPELPTETPALWNPCDALDVAFVKKQFGSTTTEHDGSPTAPECRFAPDKESGEAVVTANYLLFPGSLDEAWKTMGQSEQADVRTPRIAGADDARVVVAVADKQLYVTGFVQNGDLIQQVDVVDPAPFAKARVVRGVEAALTVLSAHAARSDAGTGPRAGTPSPSAS